MADAHSRQDQRTGKTVEKNIKKKPALVDKTVCSECGGIYLNGEWIWDRTDDEEAEAYALCPACSKEEEEMLAGQIELKGDFYRTHAEEVERKIRDIENEERELHPLERIVAYDVEDGHAFIATSGIRLAQKIGEGLYRSFKGDLILDYGPDDTKIALRWER
ncbi:MAG: ATPase [Chitinivibrionales bacterium]|nr:ATPase [Chitinivibrionales bacterium]